MLSAPKLSAEAETMSCPAPLAAAWVTVSTWPSMVIVPVRELEALFAVTP